MSLHEIVLLGCMLVGAICVVRVIRQAGRAEVGGAPSPLGPKVRHVVLVGGTAIWRLSLRRALEQRMDVSVSEAKDAPAGLTRLTELASPDIDLIVVVDLVAGQGEAATFVQAASSRPGLKDLRVLLIIDPDESPELFQAAPDLPGIEPVTRPASIAQLVGRVG